MVMKQTKIEGLSMLKNTKKMINILFPKTDILSVIKAVEILEDKAPLYKVSTDLDMALFLSQVREETGSKLQPISESLNYSPTGLIRTFRYYKKLPFEAKQDGRVQSKKANEESIANKVYANRLGNGGINSNDGYKFRGAGSLQITGRMNFENVQIRITRYDNDSNIDIVNSDDIHTLEGSLISALAFWIWKDLNLTAKLDIPHDDKVDNITSVINLHTHSYEDRLNHFHNIKHLI
jgi:putative chitinase